MLDDRGDLLLDPGDLSPIAEPDHDGGVRVGVGGERERAVDDVARADLAQFVAKRAPAIATARYDAASMRRSAYVSCRQTPPCTSKQAMSNCGPEAIPTAQNSSCGSAMSWVCSAPIAGNERGR